MTRYSVVGLGKLGACMAAAIADRGFDRGQRVLVCNANATRKRIVSTSAMPTVPATFQCTFSNVTQKSVARKKKSVVRLTDFD